MNVNKLRGKIVEHGLTVGQLAERIGIGRAALYRKMKDGSFTVREAQLISRELSLSSQDVMDIFFTNFVA